MMPWVWQYSSASTVSATYCLRSAAGAQKGALEGAGGQCIACRAWGGGGQGHPALPACSLRAAKRAVPHAAPVSAHLPHLAALAPAPAPSSQPQPPAPSTHPPPTHRATSSSSAPKLRSSEKRSPPLRYSITMYRFSRDVKL